MAPLAIEPEAVEYVSIWEFIWFKYDIYLPTENTGLSDYHLLLAHSGIRRQDWPSLAG